MSDRRGSLLDRWAGAIIESAQSGALDKGRVITIHSIEAIAGPRAGALELHAGLDSGRLLSVMAANEFALHRQFIPWEFAGTPSVYMAGRYVRIEAGWSPDLAESKIKLSDLGQHPAGAGRWLVGKNELGNVLTAGVNDDTPHWLISGTTGSGKTTAMVSAIGQLAKDAGNRLVLIDCKHGASFRGLRVRGLVGPLADDVYSARAALAWCAREVAARYSGSVDTRRIVLVVDEVQALADDAGCQAALKIILAQGRGACVHALVATQHPTVAALGDSTIGKNLVGRLALRVMGPEASRVAVGSKSPRADYLLGHGDAYAVAPAATHRVQVAMFDGMQVGGEPDLTEWPEAGGGDLPGGGAGGWPSGAEIGVALASASRGEGRVKFQKSLTVAGLPGIGNDRAVRLLALARETIDQMSEDGLAVRPSCEEYTHESSEIGGEN